MTKNTELSIGELKSSIEDLELSISVSKDILRGMLSSRSLEAAFSATESLEKKILSVLKSRSEINGRTLINEQIFAEYTNKEEELQQEFSDKMIEIQDQNRRKDNLITQLNNKKSQLQRIADTNKTDQGLIVIPPSESIIDMHIHIEQCRDSMQRYARKLQIKQKYREALIDKCNEVWGACIKVHALHKNPINRKQGLDRHSEYCLKPPRRDFSFEIKDEEDSESDRDLLSPQFPIKHNVRNKCPVNIPSLDFSKLPGNGKDKKLKKNQVEVFIEKRCSLIHESIHILKKNLAEYNEILMAVTQENDNILKANEELTSRCLENSHSCKSSSFLNQIGV